MDSRYPIVIVGAGPAGLSAAARAAQHGVGHLLLESSESIAQTIRRFQKGKRVMSEPSFLPLRSALGFSSGSREETLAAWAEDARRLQINLRTEARVSGISGQQGDFQIALAGGERINAECIVVAIGVQGNLRLLEVPGADLPCVQYQLDDPAEYQNEVIVVVGAGDAGIENAVALAKSNRVILVNRQHEFDNCRPANLAALESCISRGLVSTRTGTVVERIEPRPDDSAGCRLILQSSRGEERELCDRVIVRIGATPPIDTLQALGIATTGKDAGAVPVLSERFESSVPGIYVVGAVAGYPLIKQALNQGYDVVDHILGMVVEPADQALLRARLARVPGVSDVDDGIALLRDRLALFGSLTALQMRELLSESEILVLAEGEVIFRKNDYSNSFFSILGGSVEARLDDSDTGKGVFHLAAGEFFGELSLLSGRRRSATVVAGTGCVLMETPRRAMLRVLQMVPSVQRRLDEVSLKRIVRNCYGSALNDEQLDYLVSEAKVRAYAKGECIFREGDEPDALYMIRRGSVTVSRFTEGRDVVLAYVSAGNYIGEMALLSDSRRTATVRAAAATEMILIEAERFRAVVGQNAVARGQLAERYLERIRSNEFAGAKRNGELVHFLMDQGVGEATDLFLIDFNRCIRCNGCERACADVHGGTSRFRRMGGKSFEQLHVPASCRHCENPSCMKECPADAIHRSVSGETFIGESCVGCGKCGELCPFGVIQLTEEVKAEKPSLWRALFGLSGKNPAAMTGSDSGKKAVKCDMCVGILGGPACVRACPTGAAFRVGPDQMLSMFGK